MNDQELQYQFSKYLETAVKRCRKDYLIKKYKHESTEDLIASDEFQIETINPPSWQINEDIWGDKVLLLGFLDEHLEEPIINVLKKLRPIELEIFCRKTFAQISYREIAIKTKMNETQAASICNYAKKKITKGASKKWISGHNYKEQKQVAKTIVNIFFYHIALFFSNTLWLTNDLTKIYIRNYPKRY